MTIAEIEMKLRKDVIALFEKLLANMAYATREIEEGSPQKAC